MIGRLVGGVLAAAGMVVAPPLVATATADAPGTCSGAATSRPQNAWLSDSISTAGDLDWFRFTTHLGEHVLVTLGGLSGNLTLGLYGAHCHLVAASAHDGDRFEEIYRDLDAGTHFVRVVGVSGATSSYDLRFRTLPNRVVVVSSHGSVSAGNLSISGELLNNTAHSRDFVDVDVAAYNRANRLVADGSGTMDFQVIPAWHRAPFDVSIPVPAAYDHDRLSIDDVDQTGPVVPNLSLTRSQSTSTGQTVISGRIHNGNPYPVTQAIVACVGYNSRGRVLVESSDYLGSRSIPAGGSAPYSLAFDTLAGTNALACYVSARPIGR